MLYCLSTWFHAYLDVVNKKTVRFIFSWNLLNRKIVSSAQDSNPKLGTFLTFSVMVSIGANIIPKAIFHIIITCQYHRITIVTLKFKIFSVKEYSSSSFSLISAIIFPVHTSTGIIMLQTELMAIIVRLFLEHEMVLSNDISGTEAHTLQDSRNQLDNKPKWLFRDS